MFDSFDNFEPVPIASASLAQVHKATYKGILTYLTYLTYYFTRNLHPLPQFSGEPVAVKVQYPGLREQCAFDVATISLIVNFVSKVTSVHNSFVE